MSWRRRLIDRAARYVCALILIAALFSAPVIILLTKAVYQDFGWSNDFAGRSENQN